MKTIKNIVLIACISVGFLVQPTNINAQINTRVKTGTDLSGKINLSGQTPVLRATRDDIAKAIPNTKLKKTINRKVTKEYADKIPSDYRPKAGKLNAKLTVREPYSYQAYVDFVMGNYEPSKNQIGLTGLGWLYGGDLFVKFRAKPGKRYLIQIKINTGQQIENEFDWNQNPVLYTYQGDTQTVFELEKENGKLVNRTYVFELIISSNTYNWIQVPFGSSVSSNDWSDVVPWNFVSASVVEL